MALLQEIQVPLLAVNDTTLTVVELAFSAGQPVKKGDVVMVLETSKTTYDVEAGADGYIQYLCEKDHDYEVNQVVARIYSEMAETQTAVDLRRPVPGESAVSPASIGLSPVIFGTSFSSEPASGGVDAVYASRPLGNWDGEALFSREANLLITASGIDRSVFRGKDFVSRTDVLALQEPGSSAPTGPIKAGKASPARTILPVDPAKAIVSRLSSGKKREIEYLGEVQSTGLTSTIHSYVETDGLFVHINRSLKYLKDSILPVIVYEASRLLSEFPLLNAYFTGEEIAVYKEVNIGFAIDVDKGLKVLKIGGAAQQNIQGIEAMIIDLSGRYLDDNLQIDDLTDITFTITDLSSEGVAFFRPLINKMNSSILGVSSIDERSKRFILSLTFDHRVTEGKLAARFLKVLKERLESYRSVNPSLLHDIACFKCFKTLKEDLSGAGFARCITPEGKEGYICQSCLKGF